MITFESQDELDGFMSLFNYSYLNDIIDPTRHVFSALGSLGGKVTSVYEDILHTFRR